MTEQEMDLEVREYNVPDLATELELAAKELEREIKLREFREYMDMCKEWEYLQDAEMDDFLDAQD